VDVDVLMNVIVRENAYALPMYVLIC